MKTVEVDYLEGGTFIGSEEEVFLAGIEYNETCILIKKSDWEKLKVKGLLDDLPYFLEDI
jgi:hypothetical protein